MIDLEEYLKTEQWLDRAFKLNTEYQHLKREIRRLELEATSVVSPPGHGGKSSVPSDKVGRAAVKIADEQVRLRGMMIRIIELKQDIRDTIMRYTETPRHEEALLRRYVEFQRWEDIAEDMSYEAKYIYTLRRQGIEQITVNKGKGLLQK